MKMEIKMSMIKKSETATNMFEDMEAGAATPAASTTTAVATAGAKSVAVAVPQVSREDMMAVAALKNSMALEFDTFKGIVIEKGFFTERGSTDSIGNEITLSLMSWQDLWVCTPKDNSAPAELVRYSDDGVTASDGTNMAEHLNALKIGGYPNAKIEQRIVLAGGLEKSEKFTSLLDKPILINLSPSNRKQFIQYQGESAYAISKGRKQKEQALNVKLTCTVAKHEKNTYGLVKFDFAD
jgi:hypothetical protein